MAGCDDFESGTVFEAQLCLWLVALTFVTSTGFPDYSWLCLQYAYFGLAGEDDPVGRASTKRHLLGHM